MKRLNRWFALNCQNRNSFAREPVRRTGAQSPKTSSCRQGCGKIPPRTGLASPLMAAQMPDCRVHHKSESGETCSGWAIAFPDLAITFQLYEEDITHHGESDLGA
jgi:hypothetical protein